MGLLRFSYRSEILSLHTNITVTLPSEELTYYPLTDIKREEGVAARRKWEYRDGMKFQTVYLLHGGGDDDTCVVRKSNIERYAEENCVMTVTAQANDSFFMDTQYGYKYFTFLTEELPKVIQTMFPSSPKREDKFCGRRCNGRKWLPGTGIEKTGSVCGMRRSFRRNRMQCGYRRFHRRGAHP